MVKITVDVTNKELDDLEDMTVAWNLCDKHNGTWNAKEEDYFKFTQTCKKCIKINKTIRSRTLHLWGKLVTAYEKSTKKGRKF